jgi:acyl-CoA synthetase (AMP-forming)/AMP-acid ligase II
MTNRTFNIADLFEIVVDSIPDRPAAVCGEARVSYRELDERANQLAHYLSSRGIAAGDHVGLYLYNCNEYLEGMLACFKIRAVPININYRYVGEELVYVIDNADMKACIHGREFIPALQAIRDEVPNLKVLISRDDDTDEDLSLVGAVDYETALQGQSRERDFEARSEDDLFILYTGGTTGMPKGVMWPHKALFFAALGGNAPMHPDGPVKTPEELANRVNGENQAICAHLAPLMHGACWWAALASLLAGRVAVLYPGRSFKPEEIWPLMAQEKVNIIALVGDAMAIPLLDTLKANPDTWDLTPLFVIGSGGAVFSKWVQEEYKQLFPNMIISNSFGSSETGMQGGDDGGKSDGLGRIPRHEFADVITEDHRFVEPGSGEQGYLARGGHIPIGYYGDPEKTAKTFIEVEGKRWTLTGDLATVNEEGMIVVYGRGNNCINSGGEKIFPEEVEQAMKSHPSVLDALVVATPDERFGSRVAGVASLREGTQLTLEEIMTHCREHIAGYKIPRELHVVDEIKRAPSGKPNYQWAKDTALAKTNQVN